MLYLFKRGVIMIELISTILVSLILVYMVYYSIVSIEAYVNKPEEYDYHDPNLKFLVLIPAVNEEKVINNPVIDLVNQDYPDELYDVYVIADHCKDNTARIARENGANVITENNNLSFKRYGIGKSNTLDYGLHCIKGWKYYDYLIVIDSDNNVSSNFISEMNNCANHYKLPEAIQSRLDSKKGKGFINAGLNISFMRSNYFQQVPESKYGCSSLFGTGFATNIKKVIIHIGGFRFKTLIEDCYEELDIIRKGGNVRFADKCYVVNENYSKFKQASSGIVRWSRGSCQCAFHFLLPSVLKVIINPSHKSFHSLCRTSTLSKSVQLIILWFYLIWQYVFSSSLYMNYNFIYLPKEIKGTIFILSLIMSLNMVVFENLFILFPKYGLKSVLMIVELYIFQSLYNLFNIIAVLTFYKHQWIVSDSNS